MANLHWTLKVKSIVAIESVIRRIGICVVGTLIYEEYAIQRSIGASIVYYPIHWEFPLPMINGWIAVYNVNISSHKLYNWPSVIVINDNGVWLVSPYDIIVLCLHYSNLDGRMLKEPYNFQALFVLHNYV